MDGMIEASISITTFAFVFWAILIGVMIYWIIKLYYKKLEVEEGQHKSEAIVVTGDEQHDGRDVTQ